MMGKNHIVSAQHEQGIDSRLTVAPLFNDEGVYEIKLRGFLAAHWAESLGDLALTYENEENTLLSGTIADQSALHGILAQIRNLGLTLLSVTRIEANVDDR
ncbi:MAG: hypothetical protein R2911_10415 [Caldilineaceae bacterium]